MLVSGAAALAVSLLIWGVAGWGLWKGTNWNTYKPTGWLLFEARVGAPGEADAAISEVADRVISERPPTRGQLNLFVDVVLAHQADHAKPGGPAWAKAMDVLLESVPLSDAERNQALASMLAITGSVRQVLMVGHGLPVRLVATSRSGSTPHYVHTDLHRVLVDGVDKTPQWDFDVTFSAPANPLVKAEAVLPLELTAGSHLVVIEWRRTLPDQQLPGMPGRSGPWHDTFQIQTIVRVVDQGEDDGVGLVSNEDIRPQLAHAVRIIDAEAKPPFFPQTGVSTVFVATVGVSGAPSPIAFEVFARQGDNERRIGSISFPAGVNSVKGVSAPFNEIEVGPIDVILRPSEDVIRSTVDLMSAWDGELIFENVPVLWPPAQPAPPPE